MPEPRQHAQNRGVLESILRHIPGFKGYLEKEYRRESDALQREWLSDCLVRAKRSLDDYTRALADAGDLDSLPQWDRVRLRVDKLAARIRGAHRGYSGWFDLVQIDESVLDRVYDYDASLLDQVEQFAKTLEKLPTDKQPGTGQVADMLARSEKLEQAWDQREDILKGVD
jgi:hypothetical protein